MQGFGHAVRRGLAMEVFREVVEGWACAEFLVAVLQDGDAALHLHIADEEFEGLGGGDRARGGGLPV